MQKTLTMPALGLVISGLLFSAGVVAAEQTPAAKVSPVSSSVGVQGVQVAIDPATGRLVAPTAAQRARLSRAMLNRDAHSKVAGSAAAPRNALEARATFHRITLKSGRTAVGMALPEDRMSSLVAERRADGTVAIHHAGDTQPAAAVEVTQ